MDLDTFEGRKKWGEEAEVQFKRDMERTGHKIQSSKLNENWTSQYDLINGDFFILPSNARVDVKRASITERSLIYFEGEYYVVYNSKLSKVIVLKPRDIKDRMLPEDFEERSSGVLGLSFKTLLRFPHQTLTEFKTSLKKLI
jgi:hypothetical protein